MSYSKLYIKQFILLCSTVYFISYISRINLSAIVVAVTQSGFSTKQVISLALTASSISYGAGQIISGYLSSKYKPQSVIFAGFIITAAMNLCVTLIKNDVLLIPIWTVNGFAHALMWPPLVAIMASYLCGNDYSKCCLRVSYASSAAIIIMYLLSPLIIKIFGFKAVFLLSCAAAAVMAVVWKRMFKKLISNDYFKSVRGESRHIGKTTSSNGVPAIMWVILAAIMTAIVMQGILRDGVTTWMPSYVSETFNIDGAVAILSGAAMPIFSMISFKATEVLHKKFLKNELVCAGAMFALGAFASVILSLFSDKSVVLSVFLSALLVGSMHGVNLVLICMVPPYFTRYANVSLISGVINSCVYLGSAISTYGILAFSQHFGWQATIMLWAVIALIGTMICLLFAKKWKKALKHE